MQKPSSCSILLVFSRSGGELILMQIKSAGIAAAAWEFRNSERKVAA
jgi:hypothetical protein